MLKQLADIFFGDPDVARFREALHALGVSKDSGCWALKYPKRAIEEIYKMQENTDAELIPKGSQLTWLEEIATELGNTYVIEVITEDFPHKWPKVFVREPQLAGAKHVYGDGSLCLMKDSSYSSGMSVLDFRNMACSWLWCHELSASGEFPGAEEAH